VTAALHPLRLPAFRRLAAVRLVDELGDWLGEIALAVLVFDQTGSPLATAALFLALLLSMILKRLLYVSAPNEALIFSGRVRQSGKREVGFRVVRGGRALRVPLFEVVDG